MNKRTAQTGRHIVTFEHKRGGVNVALPDGTQYWAPGYGECCSFVARWLEQYASAEAN